MLESVKSIISDIKIGFSEHNLSSCYQNGTCEGSLERSQHQECFLHWTHGHLHLWLNPQSGQSPEFSMCSIDQIFHGDDEKIREV
jgi:hypothetical protein